MRVERRDGCDGGAVVRGIRRDIHDASIFFSQAFRSGLGPLDRDRDARFFPGCILDVAVYLP